VEDSKAVPESQRTAEVTDNVGMDTAWQEEFQGFVKSAWTNAVNHRHGENMPHEKFTIGEANDWIVENVKEATGIDMTGFVRNMTNDFITHVHNHHGNEETEKNRRQTAVKPNDFEAIPIIIESPDYLMVGAKLKARHGLRDTIIYAKAIDGKTFIYTEEIQPGRRNKALSSSTLFIKNTLLKKKSFYNIIESNKENDLTKAKIIGRVGGHPDSETNKNVRGTEATSAEPANTLLSTTPPDLSSPYSGLVTSYLYP
jgi:hypothetical protein